MPSSAESATGQLSAGIVVTLLVSGCGAVRTEEEFVGGGDQVIQASDGTLEILDTRGRLVASFPGGSWVTWRRQPSPR